MPACKTLEFSSPSLSFDNAKVKVQLLPRDSNRVTRISWNVGGRPFYSTDQVKIFDTLVYESRRTTIYRHEGLALSTPEHLAPVFLMWPGRSFCVNVKDGAGNMPSDAANLVPEIPLMDGSALPFFLTLRREVGTPEEIAFYDAPVSGHWDLRNAPDAPAYGHVRICPAETFEVEYRLERPDVAGGFSSYANVSIYSPEDLFRVFQARTFIAEKEYEAARAQGLLAGVDEGCGLLLKSPVTQSSYRIAEEPALHKILDLLGDLAFAFPALPKIRIEILNGGHTSHHQILKEVLPYLLKAV